MYWVFSSSRASRPLGLLLAREPSRHATFGSGHNVFTAIRHVISNQEGIVNVHSTHMTLFPQIGKQGFGDFSKHSRCTRQAVWQAGKAVQLLPPHESEIFSGCLSHWDRVIGVFPINGRHVTLRSNQIQGCSQSIHFEMFVCNTSV